MSDDRFTEDQPPPPERPWRPKQKPVTPEEIDQFAKEFAKRFGVGGRRKRESEERQKAGR